MLELININKNYNPGSVNELCLFKKVTFFRVTSSVVVGSILYKACVAVAMFAGISPNAIKLITAVLFLIILVISMDRKKVKAC